MNGEASSFILMSENAQWLLTSAPSTQSKAALYKGVKRGADAATLIEFPVGGEPLPKGKWHLAVSFDDAEPRKWTEVQVLSIDEWRDETQRKG